MINILCRNIYILFLQYLNDQYVTVYNIIITDISIDVLDCISTDF